LFIGLRRHAHEMRLDLRAELLHRAERDQTGSGMTERERETGASVDADNLAWLKEGAAEAGSPEQSVVGEDTAHATWLLAQHADRDPAFQHRCLDSLILVQSLIGPAASGRVPARMR